MPKTIAWIEDDTDILDPLVEPLEDIGYRLIRFSTIADALARIKEIKSADLILLDMLVRPGPVERKFANFPGLDLLRELRETEKIKTPVVVLTVVGREEVRQRLEKLGVSNIINKPVRPSELKERVERVLKKP